MGEDHAPLGGRGIELAELLPGGLLRHRISPHPVRRSRFSPTSRGQLPRVASSIKASSWLIMVCPAAPGPCCGAHGSPVDVEHVSRVPSCRCRRRLTLARPNTYRGTRPHPHDAALGAKSRMGHPVADPPSVAWSAGREPRFSLPGFTPLGGGRRRRFIDDSV